MRKNFGAKAYTYPQPVLIIASYDENGNADAMNAAWGGISDDKEISMCLSAEHKTVKNILESSKVHCVQTNYTFCSKIVPLFLVWNSLLCISIMS